MVVCVFCNKYVSESFMGSLWRINKKCRNNFVPESNSRKITFCDCINGNVYSIKQNIKINENKKKIKIEKQKNNNVKKILYGVLIGAAIVATIVVVFSVGILLYKFGARLPIDKISGLLRNSNARFNNLGRINFSSASHVYQMPKTRMPVNGHGGTYSGRIWQMDMNYVPKKGNDRVKPMTQRELIKLDLDLVKGEKGSIMPRKNRKRVVKVYEKLLKKDKVNIPFKLNINGESEPDFSKVCFEVIKIKAPSGRYRKRGIDGNMEVASKKCSRKWHLPLKDFNDWRNDLQLTWHEAKNCKLYLVPHNIHENVVHEGLIAQQKNK
jgi:F0F1-type ATP synthase assembly protein I